MRRQNLALLSLLRPPVKFEDSFYCREKKQQITINKCYNDFLDANAFANRNSVCHFCPTGKEIRRLVAES
jgi:hypothetical protein